MSTGVFTASYCNDAGEILAYSNGLWVLNQQGKIIENSSGLNPTLASGQTMGSYLGNDSGFFLGKPGDPNIIYLIHLDFGYHPANDWPYAYVGRHLMATTIDLSPNNGAGNAIAKNEVLIDGVLMTATAVRHANGRDWWIMCSDADENRHYRLLLTPEGFKGPFTQEIGTKPNPIGLHNSVMGNTFSPSGRYYVDNNSYIGFSLFEFDRCSGLLSNERRMEWPELVVSHDDNLQHSAGGGIVFSPDERLLYTTLTYKINQYLGLSKGSKPYLFQFDLSETDLLASIDTINPIDPLKFFPYKITDEVMFGAEMGPDGRIYIMHRGDAYCTVQYPNVRGKGCRFKYNDPDFHNIIGQAIPVLPNFRLGPQDGSICDTLGLDNVAVANFRVDDTLGQWTYYFYDLSYKEPATWLWTFGDGSTSQDTSTLHQYMEPGKYQVCLTVSNNNGSNTYCRDVYVGISGLEESQLKAPGLLLYPNPAREAVFIKLEGINPARSSLVVNDMYGQTLLVKAFDTNSTFLDIRNWQPGVYVITVKTSGRKHVSSRLVVGP